MENMDKERVITELLRSDPQPTTVDLAETLRASVADVTQDHPDASVTLSCPEPVAVDAISRLATAFEELLRNAVVHNDSADPTVSVTVETGPETTTVQVVDDGPGIPAVEVDVLTGAAEETAVSHGQGLGLWLVYLIVRRSGGSIRFADGEDGGSVVTVSLRTAE
jgi:signal transduction histidine kinase